MANNVHLIYPVHLNPNVQEPVNLILGSLENVHLIPPQDYDFLFEKGVAAIYGPGTNIPAAAAEIIGIIGKQRLAAE